ncbi:MAG: MATE family efflux transporter [Bacteroidota bacterium]
MNREILKLAIPNIISNISVPFLSTVDTALMGQLSSLHLGAVGIGSMIFNFLYWNFGFLRMGTTGITAQGFGANNEKQITNTLGRALLISIGLGIVLILIQIPLIQAGVYLMNVDPSQQALIETYFYIRIWAAPATMSLYALSGWFFGMQNAKLPLIMTVAGNVLNIIMSYFFVIELEWEVAGVAWGTVIAQYLSFALGLLFTYLYYNDYLAKLRLKAIIIWEELKAFLSINADIFIRTFLLTLSFGFFYSQSSLNGATILAVNTILMQFISWMSYGIDGFAFATESLVGKYKGANDWKQVKNAIRYSFFWGMGFALLYSLIYWILGTSILYLFTSESHLIEATTPFLIWMIIFPLAGTPCYIWDGIYIGLTASRAMKNMMILSIIVFFIFYYGISINYGNHGLWLTMVIFMLVRGLFLHLWMFRKGLENVK